MKIQLNKPHNSEVMLRVLETVERWLLLSLGTSKAVRSNY